MATKSSPTETLDPLLGADAAILSIMLITELVSLTAALKAAGVNELTWNHD